MEPTSASRESLYLEVIELLDLIEFCDPDKNGTDEQTPAFENSNNVARGVDFAAHVGNLPSFHIDVNGGFIAGFKEEGGDTMP